MSWSGNPVRVGSGRICRRNERNELLHGFVVDFIHKINVFPEHPASLTKETVPNHSCLCNLLPLCDAAENTTAFKKTDPRQTQQNLSVDTNADRCKSLIWCSRSVQRRRRRCLAPKRSSCLGSGCRSQPLPSKHRCVRPLKVLFSCYWAFSGFMAVIFQVGVVR